MLLTGKLQRNSLVPPLTLPCLTCSLLKLCFRCTFLKDEAARSHLMPRVNQTMNPLFAIVTEALRIWPHWQFNAVPKNSLDQNVPSLKKTQTLKIQTLAFYNNFKMSDPRKKQSPKFQVRRGTSD